MKLRNLVQSALLLLVLASGLRAADLPFDLVLENGHIVDGTGSPWYSGDVGIRGGRIAAIGNLAQAPAKRRIDVAGKVVAPGFIDMLGQSELTILVEPRLPSKIFQGITTEITGEGGSIAPLKDAIVAEDKLGYEHFGIKPDWRTLGRLLRAARKAGDGDQPRHLRRRHPGAAAGARRGEPRADARGAGAHEGAGARGHGAGRGRASRPRSSTRRRPTPPPRS